MKNWIIISCLAIWVLVSQITFAVKHPELTDTERFMNFFDALLFQKINQQTVEAAVFPLTPNNDPCYAIGEPVVRRPNWYGNWSIAFTEAGLVFEGDPNCRNEAADAFFNEFLKPLADDYIKGHISSTFQWPVESDKEGQVIDCNRNIGVLEWK